MPDASNVKGSQSTLSETDVSGAHRPETTQAMSNETHSEVLTLSSASTGISCIVVMAASGCLLASLPLLRTCLAWLEPNNLFLRQPLPLNVTLCCLALGLLITALGPVLLYFSSWGRWRIDDEGIEFRHFLKKRPLYLLWRDVDQVHWAQMRSGLQGKGVRLRAYWDWFPKSKRDEARSRLEAFLSRAFDLSTVPIRAWSFEPNFRSRATWALKIVGLAISVAAAILGLVV